LAGAGSDDFGAVAPEELDPSEPDDPEEPPEEEDPEESEEELEDPEDEEEDPVELKPSSDTGPSACATAGWAATTSTAKMIPETILLDVRASVRDILDSRNPCFDYHRGHPRTTSVRRNPERSHQTYPRISVQNT
jgi:hypothetical protein